ncbi:MAG: exodeoxyribonuclease VII large subunit [Rickettsiales bacterium]|nr:exodeoxyribonuclease VII large subunit [Rickettsiales bacterium]
MEDFNHNQPIYSVSDIAHSIKRMVEDRFGVIRIRGEVSGWKQATSGHVYFRLKDSDAVIDGVCWRGTASKLNFKVEDGLEVICSGKITTYPGKSSYQIVVDSIEPAGVGALMALLEKRRKQFEEEGLFKAERKKKLPFLPQVIGVVTSPTGAVIRDILHRLEDRFPVQVLVWPVAVQGEGAAEQIAAAIAGFNNLPPQRASCAPHEASSGLMPPADGITSTLVRPDVLIVARGGGSIEDLWAFNEEIVVRAAASSNIPLISAVGHETDTTLIDYVADRRAPTPTAAAEMAVPVRDELRLTIGQLAMRLAASMQRLVTQRAERLQGLCLGLPKPVQLIEVAMQRLDDRSERLLTVLPALLARKEQQLQLATASLRPQRLLTDIGKTQALLLSHEQRLQAATQRMIERHAQRLQAQASLLENLNYKRVLERGYALVRDAQGHVISSSKLALQQQALNLSFNDGDVAVKPVS